MPEFRWYPSTAEHQQLRIYSILRDPQYGCSRGHPPIWPCTASVGVCSIYMSLGEHLLAANYTQKRMTPSHTHTHRWVSATLQGEKGHPPDGLREVNSSGAWLLLGDREQVNPEKKGNSLWRMVEHAGCRTLWHIWEFSESTNWSLVEGDCVCSIGEGWV